VANGCKLQALTRTTSDRSRLSEFNIHWVEGALEDVDSLRRLVRGADAVVHCAGAVRGATQAHFDRLNVDGVARLVRAAVEQHPLPRFLLISSLAAREPGLSVEQHPLPRFLLISSLAAREPGLSHYAGSKRRGETVLADQAGNMSWVVLRPPAVYGPGDKETLPLWRWMARGFAFVLGSGNTRFSMLYVDDLSAAIQNCVLNEHFPNEVFELHDGHPEGYAWQNVIDTVAHLKARSVRSIPMPVGKIREFRHPDWVCDNTAFTQETGWTPRVSLEEGLRRTLQF
jgi:nucleoside-diphosphate-sugar epimerase